MDDLKEQIQIKLAANVIIDKCAHSERLIFSESWCAQERIIRFTTPFFRVLFPLSEGSGKWKTGDAVMYEAFNQSQSFAVKCVLDVSAVGSEHIKTAEKIVAAYGASCGSDGISVLKTWDLPSAVSNPNGLFNGFDKLINQMVPDFECEVSDCLNSISQVEQFKEGAKSKTLLNKYERNIKARAACLAFHGTACAVCGIDFGKAYGPEFAGRIEVHHIVPLSEIGEEYIVDPVKDLIPVCPNCHAALHGKPGGVYTVSELKELMSRLRRKD